MSIRIIILGVILALFSFVAQATFQEASKYYKEEQYEKAFNEFSQLAQIGHKPSQFNVGAMYLEGLGVKQNLVKAWAWVKLSDEGRNKEKEILEEIKSYFPESSMIEKAKADYNALYSKYSSDAISKLYAPEITGDIQEFKSLKPIEDPKPEYPSDKSGWVTFAFHLSSSGHPIDIRVVESFPENVFERYSRAVFKNWKFQVDDNIQTDETFKYKLEFVRWIGDEGNGVTRFKELSRIKEKAIAGDPVSQYWHAKYGWYNNFGNTPFNSTAWFYKAARSGVSNAQYRIAERLLEGNGCKKDPAKAMSWLTLSASSDFAASQFKLASLAFDKGDNEGGLGWLTQALQNNIDNPAFDSHVLSYEMVHYIYQNNIEGVNPQLIIQQLEKVKEAGVSSPVNVYQYYSYTYKNIGKFDKALDYQKQAIETLEDWDENIPQEMLDNLAYLRGRA